MSTPTLEVTKRQVLDELVRHVGRENGIHMRDLVARITGSMLTSEALERKVRELIVELRAEKHQICAHPANGYYLAANTKEVNETCKFLLDRAVTTVNQVAAMKNREAPDLHELLGVGR